VTEETRPTSLTSQHSPERARSRRPPPFEGSAALFRGRGASAVREWATQCHGTDTSLAAHCHTVAGVASTGELAEQRRGMIPRHVRGAVWIRL
jgi:hypothetical protein